MKLLHVPAVLSAVVYILACCRQYVFATEFMNCDVHNKTGLPSDVCSFDLRMKGAQPQTNDEYLCSGYQVSSDIFGTSHQSNIDGYIVRYEALADADIAHHVLVFGCKQLRRNLNKPWNCGKVCDGDEQIIFAWAKNAPELSLPKDVGQHIGGTTGINYIVIQIHYKKPLSAPDNSGIRMYTTRQRQKYISGIFLLLAYGITIPPDTPKFHINSSCIFNWGPGISIHPFGFRTHAHSLCRVISGYKVTDDHYYMIGKGNPQWPQAFYPVEKSVSVNPGDILAAQCTYNSTGRHRDTEIGSTGDDEMCNFYIMYYMDSAMENQRGPDTCYLNSQRQVFRTFPADSDIPLPPNPALEGVAGSHHHHGMAGSSNDHDDHEKIEKPHVNQPHVDFDSKTHMDNADVKLNKKLDLKFMSEVTNITIGQVGGLAVSQTGDLYIFHRGSNIWTQLSFTASNVYTQQQVPVHVDPILILDKNGKLKRQFGKNRFYLPHGLSLDSQENIWVTDVALHQVFRIPKGGDKPDMTLGIRFEPGSDTEHFCKPSDVAVLTTGEFFISDGYCNTRIMKFDKNGYFLKQWGSQSSSSGSDGFPPPGTFSLPHGLAVAEEKNLLCVADRENARIQCFDLEGNFVKQMHPKQFGKALFALEYCSNHGGLLFAVNGPLFGPHAEVTQGFTLDINTGTVVSMWNIPGEGLTNPHDVTVDSTNHVVYVGELNPRKVWKFQMSEALYLANKSKNGTKTAGELSSHVTLTGTNQDVSKETSMLSVVMTTKPTAGSAVVNSDSSLVNDVVNGHVYNVDLKEIGHKEKEEASDSFGPSVIIGTLLVVPVLLLVIITVIVRFYHTGYFKGCRRHSGKKVFSLGNFLHSHKGFDRLSTEDDDHDYENVLDDDSDNEEFNIVRKA